LIEFSESAENKAAVAQSVENGIAYAQTKVSYRPVADAGKNVQTTAKSTVTLDGSASTNANGDALSFVWSLTSKPSTSSAALSSSTTSKPYFIPDVAGTYTISLVVNNKVLHSRSSTVTVTASAVAIVPIRIPAFIDAPHYPNRKHKLFISRGTHIWIETMMASLAKPVTLQLKIQLSSRRQR
jgi:hypothetical protein